MKKYTALLLTLFLVACEPAYAKQSQNLGYVKLCADQAYKYALLVRYKDANINPQDVIEVVAPRLDLPSGWENNIVNLVETIYNDNLTEVEVFDKIYTPCIFGYNY